MSRVVSDSLVNILFTEDLIVNRGIISWGLVSKRINTNTINYAYQGAYKDGQKSQSFYNLKRIGSIIGSITLETFTPLFQLSNYLASLIPGQYPDISGPLNTTTELYDLDTVLEEGTGNKISKILGIGQGDIITHKVSEVNRNGVGMMGEDPQTILYGVFFGILFTLPGWDMPEFTIKIQHSSSMLPDQVEPQTEVSIPSYMIGQNWLESYGITQINGTNTFPTFGWGGGLLGSVFSESARKQQETNYIWPTSLLPANPYIPIGLIFPGQGCQYSSYIETENRTYDFRPKNTSLEYQRRSVSVQPFQQGKGLYEYVSNEIFYKNGFVSNTEISSTFPPEGAVPGRNNGFAGVAVSDYYGELDIPQQKETSRTNRATRYVDGSKKQTKIARNAPLVYIPGEFNVSNALPWNSINSYQGTSAQSASFRKSDNTNLLQEGVTTMVTAGAYPLYRGTWASEFSGRTAEEQSGTYYGTGKSQYYISTEFWNPNFPVPALSSDLANQGLPVEPNPPYRIKGGKVILYEGQRVLAGTYIYLTMGMIGNVNASKFFPGGAKELIFNDSDKQFILGDVYSRYQSNQGTIIVMTTEDNFPPSMPPSNAVPIGIILETIEGSGQPQTSDLGNVLRIKQTEVTTDAQTLPENFSETINISNRDIQVMIWPMGMNLYRSGITSSIYEEGLPFSTNVATPMLAVDSSFVELFFDPPIFFFSYELNILSNPLFAKIRTNYTVPDSRYAWRYAFAKEIDDASSFKQGGLRPGGQYSLMDRERVQDWPGPHGSRTITEI